jgi:hypothetical protein
MFSLAAMVALLVLLVLGGVLPAHLIHHVLVACSPSWAHC